MGPQRTDKSSSMPGPSRPHRHHKHSEDGDPSSLPGVQKIKKSLRQTRRMLERGNLAADVKVETERRLKSLENELQAAERAKRERAIATRYHAAKFFERQKVSRKIKQVQKSLQVEGRGKSERKTLEKSLQELRVDLNYIIHYPKADKYISLFPPEARGHATNPEEGPLESEGTKETEEKRESLRASMRERMESGEISAQPELDRDGTEAQKRRPSAKDRPASTVKPKGRGKGTAGQPSKAEMDDFFEDAGEGDEGSDEDDS